MSAAAIAVCSSCGGIVSKGSGLARPGPLASASSLAAWQAVARKSMKENMFAAESCSAGLKQDKDSWRSWAGPTW